MDAGLQDFERDWLFHLGDAGGAEAPGYNDAGWRVLNVPHDWMIEQPRSADNPSGSGGAYFPGNVAWYRKHFEVPASWARRHVAVEFEGVYHNAECWINDHYLGRHPYGYTGFAYELNRFLRYGAGNVLTVRVDVSSDPHTRWYSGAGIYRHVRLIAADTVHIPRWGVCVVTPEVSSKSALVRVTTGVRNTRNRQMKVTAGWTATDCRGRTVATTGTETVVPAGATVEVKGDIRISDPALWSPDAPNLYRLETVLTCRDKTVDRTITPFGIRRFEFSARRGFVLNDQPLLMRGGCVHHDCGPLGAVALDRAEERKVELLKANGYNAVRCAHNPPSPAFLDACDRIGMLVIDEAFDVWRARKLACDYHLHFDDWWRRDLESMLLRDRNHPSIILWSIGNELVERDLPEGAGIARMLADHVRRIEPTRPVTAGICGIWGNRREWKDVDELLSVLDVCGYNYLLDVYRSDHKRNPGRVVVATETFPLKAFEYWQAAETMPWVVGDFVWTALDYLGETGVGHARYENEAGGHFMPYPWLYANCGDIDPCGWKRPQSYYRDVLWRRAKVPFIAVRPPDPEDKKIVFSGWGWPDAQASWNWSGCEGEKMQVDVYFECDEIEIRLNGRPLARRPATKRSRYTASFKVPYAPGELKAVAYREGRAVAESVLVTTGPAKALRLRSDRNPIAANRNDLAYVTVEAVDARGRRVPDAEPTAFLTIRGPAVIAAVAVADPKDDAPLRGNVRGLWRGRAMVVVQPTGEAAGAVTVSAQADGLRGGELEINAIAECSRYQSLPEGGRRIERRRRLSR